MTRTLTYSAFAVASILIIFGFVTAQTYSQLGVAVVLYPALIFTAFKIFPRIGWRLRKITIPKPLKANHDRDETPKPQREPAYVADIDRRTFIKLIGATGVSFFLFSILGRWAEAFFFGRTGQLGINQQIGSGDQFALAGPSPTDGYKIADIAEGLVTYYGFINKDGAWLIMRNDTNDNSFRYAKDDSNFPGNWANRENLKYDYYYNLF